MDQKLLVADFYAGFEGEPEITFRRLAATELYLTAWDGYFGRVLEQVGPGSDGTWQGLVLHYHLATGWYDETAFEVADVPLLVSQLAAIDASVLEPTTRRFYVALLAFVEQAAAARERVILAYS